MHQNIPCKDQKTDKFLSPANEWSGAVPYREENLHCTYTLQCVSATVSIRSLQYNKRMSAKESSALVAKPIKSYYTVNITG